MTVTASRRPVPTELRPERVTALIDSREQLPFDLAPLRTVVGTLQTGDYSLVGLTHLVSIERKSLDDLLACIGQHRERFEKEIERLRAYETRALVVEADWSDLERGEWRSQITPAAAIGSVLGWIVSGIPVVMAGDRQRAGRYVGRLLYITARRRWREVRGLAEAVSREELAK